MFSELLIFIGISCSLIASVNFGKLFIFRLYLCGCQAHKSLRIIHQTNSDSLAIQHVLWFHQPGQEKRGVQLVTQTVGHLLNTLMKIKIIMPTSGNNV